MQQGSLFSFLVATTAVLAWMQLEPAVAHACTCSGSTGGYLSWPLGDADDVPLDTPVVITRYDLVNGDPESVDFALVDEAGEEIELREVSRLPQLDRYCWAREIVFMRPAEPLEPGTTYTVRVGRPPHESFTTGAESFVAQQLEPTLEYLYVGSPRGSVGVSPSGGSLDCDKGQCNLAEVRLHFDGPTQRPVWIAVRSQAHADQENRKRFWPERAEPEAGVNRFAVQLSVALAEDSRCVEIAVIGVDGEPLFQDERCEPDECVIWGSRGFSTCGSPAFSSLDVTRVAGTSCEAPLRLRQAEDGGPVYPDGTNYHASKTSTSCSASPAARSRRGLATLGILLALYSLRRLAPRRPRSR